MEGKARSSLLLLTGIFTMLMTVTTGQQQLSPDFYRRTCPQLHEVVRRVMKAEVSREPRMAASILRLHFHDCFVHGCDASILLDDDVDNGIVSEKAAFSNVNSARGFEVIDRVKAAVEKACPRLVSCADVLALAAAEGARLLRGPSWNVLLGSTDSLNAFRDVANSDLPGPGSDPQTLLASFQKQGLSSTDLVALSGAHTIGQARCLLFRNRIYTENSTIDPRYATSVQRRCPSAAGNGDSNLSPLDFGTRADTTFDNSYFRNLQAKRGLLHSDHVLASGTDDALVSLVQTYASSQEAFFCDFAQAMINMANIRPPAGSPGQVRANCRRLVLSSHS